jgi:hypothetical protein
VSKRRLRRLGPVAVAVVLAAAALAAAILRDAGSTAVRAPVSGAEESGAEESAPALGLKLATLQAFAPAGGVSGLREGDRSAADDEWMNHTIPGETIPSAVIAASSRDWARMNGRADWGNGGARWKPLGPTWAKALPNPYRDRAVYNAGTPDFSGRTVDVVVDPTCGGGRQRGQSRQGDRGRGNDECRMWIANANGGVWRTGDALDDQPQWEYLSRSFGHNNIASLELDPNDSRNDTIWAGTGEPNACGSGCEAGVGLFKSTDGGDSWQGPSGQTSGAACGPAPNPSPCNAFYNRAVGSIQVKPGDSNVIFAASGRAIRGLTSNCCGGADALIPGAAHFGLYRSLDGGRSWELVHQGAAALCTAAHPDTVSLSGTPCSPRGARRVRFDPVDPNTVYVGFFGRGIWRSRQNGAPGTFEQIMLPVTAVPTTAGGGLERPEFDVVALPGGETRMYVGVGGGAGANARFRRNDAVRATAAAAVQTSWIDLSSSAEDTPGFTSWAYCDPQCSYDNFVFAPAAHFPNSGATVDTVYLSGDNAYNENNWGPNSPRAFLGDGPVCDPGGTHPCGRDSGRGVALSTNAGVHFTDMTEDTSDQFYPAALHPDHHALTVNPTNWRQFFEVGDGGVIRSNGTFVDDSGDCTNPKGYTATRLTFCQLMLSRVPEKLTTINKSLRTLHFYQIDYSPFDFRTIVGGTQDNGSWERGDAPGSGTNGFDSPTLPGFGVGIDTDEFPSERECLDRGRGDDDDNDDNGNRGSGGEQVWVNTNIADGGHNGFDLGDPCFRLSGFQQGQTMVSYDPKNQMDMNWTSDTHFVFYGSELNAFIGVANDDNTHLHWLWSAREHVFRSTNQGRNPILTKQTHREHCNVWYGDGDVDDNGVFEPAKDICDDWKPLGDPGPAGRLTHGPLAVCPNPTPPPPFVPCPPPFPYGSDRSGGYTSVVEPAWDGSTLWAATQPGRVFVSKNADNPNPAAVVFDRIDNDPTATTDPPRFPSAIFVDPKDANHAWIVYSGFTAKTPATPGHVFEVRYVPGASTFKLLDGNEPKDELGDIPATSVAVSDGGTIFVGTDYGCVASKGDGVWRQCGSGLPRLVVSDLIYVRDQTRPPYKGKKRLYAATHGQGVWELRTGHLDGEGGGDD